MESTAEKQAGSHPLRVVPREVEELQAVTVRFCGDSGDGMQLTGTEFTKSSALAGNDLATFPDYPAEIRAPAGTLPGVSGFQLQFSSHEIFTPGDAPDVLVAMNPAALKTNLADLVPNGILIVNTDAFNETNLQKAGYTANPIEDGSLKSKYQLFKVDISKMTERALEGSGLGSKDVGRCKNMFALGMMFWMYGRSMDRTIEDLQHKFGTKNPAIAEANIKALKAGFNFGETTEVFTHKYEVKAAKLAPGRYRNITGNQAAALGFVAAAQESGVQLWLGSYPITPASDILHELSSYKNYDILTFQAEDEIAGICSAIGAAFGGKLALTTSSGPGVALKTEAMGLALMLELPLVICNVQRGGPSTGLPTKTEQADLLQAVYGRNGESPIPVIASSSPGDCFHTAYEAFRLAVKYMTPVIFLTDGYLANGSEPWPIPDSKKLPPIEVKYRTDPNGFFPYLRDPETLSRPWAIPGTPGLEHRIGGIEKDFATGNISYDPINHERMVRTRAAKVAGIANELPPTQIFGKPSGDLLVIGWGGTYGAIHQAVEDLQSKGKSVSQVHLRYLNPLPNDLGDIMKRFKHVVVAELNLGQLVKILRSTYLVDCQPYNKIQGKPFKVAELIKKFTEILRERSQSVSTTSTAAATPALTKKDFQSDQEVRWCPGCGDYAILAQVQKLMPDLGIPRHNIVFISGIGCSSRFPYYMNTYGMHSIHGRAPAIAIGLKVSRPEPPVWVATGDWDGLSIGGNHMIHMLRRNVDLKVLLFNNRIYGLTKGQVSPTSELGKKTKSTPYGSVDAPFNPAEFALGAAATFVARSVDVQPTHLSEVVRRAAMHKGAAFCEIYQNCNVFNDNAFTYMTEKAVRADAELEVEHGKPLLFGKGKDKGIRLNSKLYPEVFHVGKDGDASQAIVHDEQNSTLAWLLAGMGPPHFPTPIGVLRAVSQPTYEVMMTDQENEITKKKGHGDLEKLLNSGETWTVS